MKEAGSEVRVFRGRSSIADGSAMESACQLKTLRIDLRTDLASCSNSVRTDDSATFATPLAGREDIGSRGLRGL
jgi:hypothetical protein